MPDYYRQAVDVAIGELEKPLADLTGEEHETLANRILDLLVEWDVFREDSVGHLRGGSLLRDANYA